MDKNEVFYDDKQFVAPTYARFNVAFERGESSRLYDINGKEYICLLYTSDAADD